MKAFKRSHEGAIISKYQYFWALWSCNVLGLLADVTRGDWTYSVDATYFKVRFCFRSIYLLTVIIHWSVKPAPTFES